MNKKQSPKIHPTNDCNTIQNGKEQKQKSSIAKKIKNFFSTTTEDKQRYRASMYADLLMLGVVFQILLTIIFDMFIDRNPFGNLFCTIMTLFLLTLTYFIGIVPALATDMVFIFVVVLGSAYEFINHNKFYMGSFFWTVLPPVLCLTFYGLTTQLRKLQTENALLQQQFIKFTTIDTKTNMRTISVFKDHFKVFSKLSLKYDFPLYLYIYRVKYWNALSGILSSNEQNKVIKIIADVLKKHENGYGFAYDLGHLPPTWAIITTLGAQKTHEYRNQVKKEVADKLAQDPELSKVDVTVIASRVLYDPKDHPTAVTFLEDGIHELQYDVSAGSTIKH